MNTEKTHWLLLLFSLPRTQASARVDIWRRLKKSGALSLDTGGNLLPNSQDSRERFEWLAETIREYGGVASVLDVNSVDDLPFEQIREFFVEARDADYSQVIGEAKNLEKDPAARNAGLVRLRRRLQEINEIDYFGGKMKRKAEDSLQVLAGNLRARPARRSSAKNTKSYNNRMWVTRPRPGIDRCASAWLITNFIDQKARFTFAKDATMVPNAIPFDMYQPGGFGHVGDHCTFETLRERFKLHKKPLEILAEMIHDADLKDEKFGRSEAITVDRILKAWAATGIADNELLRKGIDLIDGLYRSIA